MHLSYQNCESPHPVETLTDRLNTLLSSSGPGYTLSLCPNQQYAIDAPIRFAAPNQEISTVGYPTDSTRAMLVVNGPVVDGAGHTTAIDGTCSKCDSVKLRNVQINGMRLGGPSISGGANVEMGGPNANQLVEYVRSFDPRGWSCLHVAEGNLDCEGVTVQNNDIGPAGSDKSLQWADGISVACRSSVIKNNMINSPTDGGIVLFGSPGTRVENNTVWIETQTLLGGINMVDVRPFGGDYRGVVVTNNTIAGGFASEAAQGSQPKGTNKHDAIIKIAIAIGPRTWFGDRYTDVSTGGTVLDNQLTGAFGYGIAMSSATNFTVQDNILIGNTSFIGVRGPDCTADDIPPPTAFFVDSGNVQESTIQSNFASVEGGESPGLVTCVVPPAGGDHWPFRESPAPAVGPLTHGWPDGGSAIVAIVLAVSFLAVIVRSVRKWRLGWSPMARLSLGHYAGYVLLSRTS